MHLLEEAATASNGERARVERDGAERAHGVDQQPLAAARGDGGDLLDRVADAARGLAMHGEDVRDAVETAEDAFDRLDVRRCVLGRLVDHELAPCCLEDPLGPLAIGAVDQDQHLAVGRHEGREHRLDREGARALHRHGHVRVLAIHDLGQEGEHVTVDPDKACVARAPIVDHRLLHRLRGRQRPRRQQERIAGLGSGASGEVGGHGRSSFDAAVGKLKRPRRGIQY